MKKYLILSLIFVNSISFSQSEINNQFLSGNLSLDSKNIQSNSEKLSSPQFAFEDVNKKHSPMLSGVMSLLVPGAGQFYNKQYWKTAIFVALEVGLVTAGLVYDKKGDDKTSEFQNYANNISDTTGWSVVRYAEWLNTYRDGTIQINQDRSLPHWQRVNWRELNDSETGSHKLPPYGEQQYYELIGKYHQYSSGWGDFIGNDNISLISPSFIFYAGERGKANDYYNIASKAVIGIYVNHFLSALDGVLSAVSYNNDISMKIRLENQAFADRIEFIPTFHARISF